MKHILSLILCLCFLSFICVPVSAHKGKTDWKGGHTDRSTGDYHYHHGYPAHDHYDVDGDGKVDCPYDFDDQTKSNADNKSSNNSTNSYPTYYPPIKLPTYPSDEPTEPESYTEEEETILPIWCFIPLIAIILFQWVSIRHKKNDIDYWQQQNQKDKEKIISQYEEKIQKQKNDYDSRISAVGSLESIRSRIDAAKKEYENISLQLSKEKNLLKAARLERNRVNNAPSDIYFAEDGLPIHWRKDSEKPYGDYTVYMSPKSQIYHTKQICTSYHSKTEHIFNVIDLARPCKKCAEGFFDFTTVPDWYRTDNEQLSVFDD